MIGGWLVEPDAVGANRDHRAHARPGPRLRAQRPGHQPGRVATTASTASLPGRAGRCARVEPLSPTPCRDCSWSGISAGCGGGSFCPDAPWTRAHAAVHLLKASLGPGYAPPPATGLVFGDVGADALRRGVDRGPRRARDHRRLRGRQLLSGRSGVSRERRGPRSQDTARRGLRSRVCGRRSLRLTSPPGASPPTGWRIWPHAESRRGAARSRRCTAPERRRRAARRRRGSSARSSPKVVP